MLPYKERGDRDDWNSYWEVSVLGVSGKCMSDLNEKMIRTVSKNIGDEQREFRIRRSVDQTYAHKRIIENYH